MVACVLVSAVGTLRVLRPQDFHSADFRIYYDAARAIRHGANPYAPSLEWAASFAPGGDLESYIDPGQAQPDYQIQSETLAVRGRVFLYGPAFAFLVIPLTFLPFEAAGVAWDICIVGFLFLAVYSLLRIAGIGRQLLTAVVLVAMASLMTAVRGELFLGQANMFLLACVCAALSLRVRGQWIPAVCLLALAVVTKPVLAVLLLFLLWKREFKFAAATVVGFVVLLLAPLLVLGSGVLGAMFSVWSFSSSHSRVFVENISPRGLLDRLFATNPFAPPVVDAPNLVTPLWLLLIALVVVISLAHLTTRPLRQDILTLLEVGLMSSALLLVIPLTEPAYQVFLIAPWVGTFAYLRAVSSPSWRPYAWLWAALGALWLLEVLPVGAALIKVVRFVAPASPIWLTIDLALVPGIVIALSTFAVQVTVVDLQTRTTALGAVRSLVQELPAIGSSWWSDLMRAINPKAYTRGGAPGIRAVQAADASNRSSH
jgi:hypothetical protein